MINYDELSDFEVNKRLRRLLVKAEGKFIIRADYCNSWPDIGPLILEHNITLLECNDEYEVSYDFNGVESTHGTDEVLTHTIDTYKSGVLRAAAICIIMKLEANQ